MKNQRQKYILASIIFIIIFVFVALGGFYSGVVYQRTHSNLFFRMRPGMRMGFINQGSGRLRMSGFLRNKYISGQITNVSGNQLTVKLVDGTSKTIILTPSTQYLQISSVNQNSVKQGEMVSILQQSKNGSDSAQIIRLNI